MADATASDIHAAPTADLGATVPTTPAVPSVLARPRNHARTVSNPDEALVLDEVRRTRIFLLFVVILCLLVIVTLLGMAGDPFAKQLHILGLGLAAVVGIAVLVHIRDAANYRPLLATLFGYCGVFAVDTGYYFWGVHSAVVLIIPIGAYFFALGRSFRGALSILLLAIVPHAVLSVLIMTEQLDDVSVLRPIELRVIDELGVLILVQFIFVASFVMARGLRRSTIDIMSELDATARAVAHREALLEEAKQELAQALRVGGPGRYTEQVIGSYRLGMLIGRGAMGEVYEAVSEPSGEIAAIKMLSMESLANPQHVQRFLREARIAASLDVPNVTRVVQVSGDDSPLPFLAMERLRGESLQEILRETPRLDPADVVEMIDQLCRGLAAAHDAGIVHRDLKPSNVFRHRDSDGRTTWKILDFGVSKLVDRSGSLTRGHVIGTPSYMAPEQARGDDVDHRADIHAMGVLAYRSITGRPAFSGTSIPAILRAVTDDTPAPPSSIAELPLEVDRVLAIALAKDPGARFGDALAFARALAAAVGGPGSVREPG